MAVGASGCTPWSGSLKPEVYASGLLATHGMLPIGWGSRQQTPACWRLSATTLIMHRGPGWPGIHSLSCKGLALRCSKHAPVALAVVPGSRRPVGDHAAAAAAAHRGQPGRRATAPGCRRPRAGRAALLCGRLAGAGGRCNCKASAGNDVGLVHSSGGALSSPARSPVLCCVKGGYQAGVDAASAPVHACSSEGFRKEAACTDAACRVPDVTEAELARLCAQPRGGAAAAGDHRGGPAGTPSTLSSMEAGKSFGAVFWYIHVHCHACSCGWYQEQQLRQQRPQHRTHEQLSGAAFHHMRLVATAHSPYEARTYLTGILVQTSARPVKIWVPR